MRSLAVVLLMTPALGWHAAAAQESGVIALRGATVNPRSGRLERRTAIPTRGWPKSRCSAKR